MKFRILSHTADLRIEVLGKTIEELFENAAIALSTILYKKFDELKTRPAGPSEKIKIRSVNINALLVDFLSEILTKSEINRRVYKVKSLKLKENELGAEIIGFPVDEFDEDIKAVTYTEVDIKQDEKGIWKTKIVMDI